MAKIHDIDSFFRILSDDGHNVSAIKSRNHIENNNGKIIFKKNSNFNVFNEDVFVFMGITLFMCLFSLVFTMMGFIAAVLAFICLTLMIIPMVFYWRDVKKNAVVIVSFFIITLSLNVMLSYRISMNDMEHDASLYHYRTDKEFMEKYEKMKNAPRWLFYME